MINEDEVRKNLLAKREQLVHRIGGTQATERREVAEGQNDNAQLWEISDVRDDLDSQASSELDQVNQALARLDAGEDEIPPTLAETKRSVGVFFVLLWAGGRRRLPPNRHRVAP